MFLGGELHIDGKPSSKRGEWAWFHGVWTYNLKVIDFQSFPNVAMAQGTLVLLWIILISYISTPSIA